MDAPGDQNPSWPGSSQPDFQTHEAVYTQGEVVQDFQAPHGSIQSFATMQPALVQTSQGAVAGFTTVQLADSQFQQLAGGAFQPVYQTNGVNYDRSSPINEYPSASHSSVLQQQIQALQNEGRSLQRPQLITVPLMLGLAQQQSQGLPSSSVSLVSSMPTVSLALDVSSGLPTTMSSSFSSLALQRDQHATQSAADTNRHHTLSQQSIAPIFHVISTGYNQAETGSSEATPLIVHGAQDADQAVTSLSLALQQQVAQQKRMAEEFDSKFEPDTTQGSPPYHTASHVQDTNETYTTAESSHLAMEADARHQLHSSGLDSTSADGMPSMGPGTMNTGMERTPTMDSNLDSTVEDATLVHVDVTQEDIDVTHTDVGENVVDTSGQPGGEEDLANLMLSQTSNMRRLLPQSLLVSQDLTIHASQYQHPSHLAGHHANLDVIHGASQLGHHDNLLESETGEESGPDGDKENQMDSFQPRKSTRLALRDRSPSPVIRPKYVPKPYSVQELWCEDCQTTYAGECPEHKQQAIYDKVVLSRAWASLPPQLQIFRLGDTTNLGIFARKNIPKRTQLGPYVAELVDNPDQIINVRFKLLLDREGDPPGYYDSSDENKCNWMIFVRPAESYAEQNLVAYQYGADIYFSAIKHIEPRQELKVWYGTPYAARLGVATHQPSEEEREAMEEADLKWPCYECNRKFKTSTLLQKHLAVHDEGTAGVGEEEDVYEGEKRTIKRPRRRLKGVKGKKKGRPAKKIREIVGEENVFQSWKKKKTNMYLNKLKKYKEPVKRSIKTLYKKTGKDSGGNEWTCIHCDLTFDNPSLLNLHTLTHAAEDVGLEELQRLTGGASVNPDDNKEGIISYEMMQGLEGAPQFSLDEANLVCPVCEKRFLIKQDLIQHASEHAKLKRRHLINPRKPYKCTRCWKAFSVEERLQKHMLCHGDEESKPLQCNVCYKRFMNNSALACHLKTHSDKKYYKCPICHEGFDQVHVMRSHTQTHAVNGFFNCPDCEKTFDDYNSIRKHMRALHSEKQYPCPDCKKIFPRPDKLKLHMLKHSTHREFMCENCGRQFKRKDKLKEHMKRIHGPGRDDKMVRVTNKPGETAKKFVPKVSPSDYHRFIYKCHTCLLGFKRRGMLVNHLAKRHPDVKPDSVPELNLPILRTQRDYYCQHCDKVYKSSSKRKAHIIKNHPGAELPPSSRKKGDFFDIPGLPNPTFSQTVGSVTTTPHPCEYCHKQYASKAKLLQHQRKKHIELVAPAATERRKVPATHSPQMTVQPQFIVDPKTVKLLGPGVIPLDIKTAEGMEVAALQQVNSDQGLQAADLLTQAMSELTQTYEFRPQDLSYQITRLPSGNVPVSSVQQTLPAQHSTIQLSDLGQTLAQAHFTAQQGQPQMSSSPAPPGSPTAQPGQHITVVSTQAPTTFSQHFIPRTWPAAANNYQIYKQ